MPEPEVGKCYQWASNKYVLGKFIKKEPQSVRKFSQYGENLGLYNTTYYTFTNTTIDKHTLDNLEECPCVGGGFKSRRRAIRRKRSTRRAH